MLSVVLADGLHESFLGGGLGVLELDHVLHGLDLVDGDRLLLVAVVGLTH